MNSLIKNKKVIVLVMLVFFLIGIIGMIYFYRQNNSNITIENMAEDSLVNDNEEKIENKKAEDKKIEGNNDLNEDENIYIHIAGEIKNEGVISLKKGSRVIDAIEKAGGVTENANLSKVNLVYVLSDGQKLVIPSKNDNNNESIITSEVGENVIQGSENKIARKVNINTANQTELETITGVGPSLAEKIIEYRTRNGKFKRKEDVKNVSGIGESKYETIKEIIEI